MPLSPSQIAALKTELNTDPRAYGYAADIAAGNQTAVAAKLNLKRTGTNGGPAINVRRPTITRQELMDAVDTRDLKANPTVLEGSILESILQADTITLTNPDGTVNRTRQNLNRLLGDTNGSQTRLGAIATEQGSRGQELFGYNTLIDDIDVANALK